MTSPAKFNALSWIIGLCAALALSLFSGHVSADARVAVRPFTGPGSAAVKAAVQQALSKHGVYVVSSESVELHAKRRRLKVDSTAGRKQIARELALNAWIEGRVRRRAGKLETTITVRDGRGNTEVGVAKLNRKTTKLLERAIKQQLWSDLGSAIQSAPLPDEDGVRAPAAATSPGPVKQPPQKRGELPRDVASSEPALLVPASEAEPAPEPVAESTNAWNASTTSPSPPSGPPSGGHEPVAGSDVSDREHIDGEQDEPKRPRDVTALELALTINSLYRTLAFTDALSPGLSGYRLMTAPMVDAGLRLYPGAFGKGAWPYLGLMLHGQAAFLVKSRSAQGTEFPTSYSGFGGGVLVRYPIRRHEVNGIVGYDQQSFRVEAANGGQPAPVPDANYQMVRAGVGAKVALAEKFKLGVEAAWLMIRSQGELASSNWFPRANGSGIEGALYADVRLAGPLNVRARLAYQRNVFSLHAQPGDKRIAGGTVDTYLSGGLGLSCTY